MTEEELKNKCTERAKIFQQAMEGCHSSSPMDCIEWFADRIAELEKEISVLLSCKNCPNNKGGLLCQKEYEGKCLSQKTQYIKELQEENADLKEENKKWRDEWQEQVQKANDEGYARTLQTIQLNKAKESNQ